MLYPPMAPYRPFRTSVRRLEESFHWQPSKLPPFSHFDLQSPPPAVSPDGSDSDSDEPFLERL